jgi:molecular chaperone GrpE
MGENESTQPADAARDDAVSEPPCFETLLEEARSEAEEHKRRADIYLDLAQRTQADFQNYKRRMEQERERLVKDANADLLRRVLPVLDDLERALSHVPGELADDGWAHGVQLIGQNLNAVLEQEGLRRIGAEGEPFDPHVHEAVAYEEHPEYGEGQVAGVYRPGYQLNERVLRAAQVAVARARTTHSGSDGAETPARSRARQRGGRPNHSGGRADDE